MKREIFYVVEEKLAPSYRWSFEPNSSPTTVKGQAEDRVRWLRKEFEHVPFRYRRIVAQAEATANGNKRLSVRTRKLRSNKSRSQAA